VDRPVERVRKANFLRVLFALVAAECCESTAAALRIHSVCVGTSLVHHYSYSRRNAAVLPLMNCRLLPVGGWKTKDCM